MRRDGGVCRIREEGLVLDRVGVQTQVLEVCLDVVDSLQGRLGSGEVRVQGKGAQVGRDGVVGGRGEEDLAKAESIQGRRCRVRVMQGIKTQNAEDEDEEEEGARGWWFCRQYGSLL